MKKGLIVFTLTFVLGLLSTNFVYAADGQTATQAFNLAVGGKSLIAVVGTPTLSLAPGAINAGESMIALGTDQSTRLRMSSFTTAAAPFNKITATIEAGSLVGTNTKLYIRLLAPTNPDNFINYADGGGTLANTGTDPLLIDAARISNSAGPNKSVDLVNHIGVCWTGTNDGDGYVIDYTYAQDGLGTPSAAALTVKFTIAAGV